MLPRNSTIARFKPRADNTLTHRPDVDPRRALVRLLAELIVEDYVTEQAQSGVKEEKREE